MVPFLLYAAYLLYFGDNKIRVPTIYKKDGGVYTCPYMIPFTLFVIVES